MKAFLTGGAGFIGSNLCDRLLAEGHNGKTNLFLKFTERLATSRLMAWVGHMAKKHLSLEMEFQANHPSNK